LPQGKRHCEKALVPVSCLKSEDKPLKPKEPKAHPTLMVSPAEATTSVVGSLTYGSTDNSDHLPTNTAPADGGPPQRTGRSSLPSSPRLSQNTSTTLAA
jgi:hypothetical protein